MRVPKIVQNFVPLLVIIDNPQKGQNNNGKFDIPNFIKLFDVKFLYPISSLLQIELQM